MLSIDDKTVTTDLDRAGYRNMGVLVKAAANYEEARGYLNNGNIDLIVINMDYTGVQAVEATKHLKSEQQYAEIPIVLTSVQTSAKVRNSAIDAGADLFVEQPLPRQYFIEKLKQLLEQQTRTNNRMELEGSVEFSFNGTKESCAIADLSNSGILVSTEAALDDGTILDLKFDLPGIKTAIAVKGEVVRTIKYSEKHPNRDTGVGIRFVEFKGDSERRLEKYIATNNDEDSKMAYYL